MKPTHHAPKIAERLMRRVLPGETSAHGVIGDLREEYAQRHARGPVTAYVWFWWQALTIYLRYLREPGPVPPSQRQAWFATIAQDTRYAWRSFRRAHSFTLVATLTLALGIGSTTAIFGLLHGVILSPLPYHEPDRIVTLWPEEWFSKAVFHLFEERLVSPEQPGAFAVVAGWEPQLHTLRDDEGTARVRGPWVTARFFDVLGGTPALGRTFNPREDQSGTAGVAVVSHGFWQGRLGGDPDVLGTRIQVRNRDRVIIGVMPRTFDFIQAQTDVVVPMGLSPTEPRYRSDELKLIARLAPDVTLEQANAELQSVITQLRLQYNAPEDWGRDARVVSLKEFLTGDIRPTILLLSGAVGLILLIALGNVAGLFLARSLDRQREVALRVALGARTGRLIRQFVTEAALLGVVGVIPGLLVGTLVLGGVLTLLPDSPLIPWEMPRLDQVGVNGVVVLFSAGLAVTTALLAGVLPAVHASKRDVRDSLHVGRTPTDTRHKRYLRTAVVAGQVALSVVLLAGSGLLVKSFWHLTSVDPGFDPETLVSFWHTPREFSSFDEYQTYFVSLHERLTAVPGVLAVAGVDNEPFFSESGATMIYPGQNRDGAGVQGKWRSVTPDFFHTTGIRIIEGRAISDADGVGAPAVGVLTQTAARELFGGESAIGRRVNATTDLGESFTVVGVVGDVKSVAFDRESPAAVYRPDTQTGHVRTAFGAWAQKIVVSVSGDPLSAVAPLANAARSYDPDAVVADVEPVTRVVQTSLTGRRVPMMVLVLFTLTALTLGAIGVYGVMSYTVRARFTEMGIRMALGATQHRVLADVMRTAVAIAGPGLVLGIALAAVTSRLLQGFVFGTSTQDPWVLGGAAGLALMVVLLASLFPARHAGRADPIRTLGGE